MTQRCVEIRSYRLKPGTRDRFDRLMSDISVPMLRHWQTDVVCHGASAHDEVSYYLIRAYASVEDRQHRQDEFYGSAQWREGPRQAILDLIEDRACYPLGSHPCRATARLAQGRARKCMPIHARVMTPRRARGGTARAATQWITRPTSVVIPMDDPTIDRLRNKEKNNV